jgi:hypothetical protein
MWTDAATPKDADAGVPIDVLGSLMYHSGLNITKI